ncbi:UNVERIFIED_ORG: hypothetical protein ABIC62_003326 [Burkholderia sp. 1595]|uniref:Uncharacterized protein n=1 Tax=Paraburkholderia terricola TaxID=169427 RepID=A0ABU1LQI1_9BURK|nr:hypothetical protein [Paraburkholderia terricola]MDR6482082.1 hypothetical protein [Paraburkholderia terricola]
MNQIEIQIVESKPGKTRIESRFNALGPVIGVPQLRGHENLLARNVPRSEPCPQSLAHLTFVPIALGTVEVPISDFQRVSGRTDRGRGIGNQRAEPE